MQVDVPLTSFKYINMSTSEEMQVLFEGALEKVTTAGSSKVWCVLTDASVMLFKMNKRSSVIASKELQVITAVQQVSGHKEGCQFEIKTVFWSTILAASSAQECCQWVEKINQAKANNDNAANLGPKGANVTPSTTERRAEVKKLTPSTTERRTEVKKLTPSTTERRTEVKKLTPSTTERRTEVKKLTPSTTERRTEANKLTPSTTERRTEAKKQDSSSVCYDSMDVSDSTVVLRPKTFQRCNTPSQPRTEQSRSREVKSLTRAMSEQKSGTYDKVGQEEVEVVLRNSKTPKQNPDLDRGIAGSSNCVYATINTLSNIVSDSAVRISRQSQRDTVDHSKSEYCLISDFDTSKDEVDQGTSNHTPSINGDEDDEIYDDILSLGPLPKIMPLSHGSPSGDQLKSLNELKDFLQNNVVSGHRHYSWCDDAMAALKEFIRDLK